MIKAYPKIFALGTDYIRDIFKGPVNISEKYDGSQSGFAKINGELIFRSKGKVQVVDAPDKLFENGVEYLLNILDKIPEDTVFYAEYFRKPKHNSLTYDRIPQNHFALFGVTDLTGTRFVHKHEDLQEYANRLDIETVPLICEDVTVNSIEQVREFMERESVLGRAQIEGLVVKNYEQKFLLGGQPMPLMAGKLVSEKFKEVNHKEWTRGSSKNKWQEYCEGFRTEARWEKAIQHLRESGDLEHTPRDIGKLIKEIQRDIVEEEKSAIKEFLWKEYSGELLRKSISRFPEFYKEYLVKRSFEENNE